MMKKKACGGRSKNLVLMINGENKKSLSDKSRDNIGNRGILNSGNSFCDLLIFSNIICVFIKVDKSQNSG